MCMLTFYHILSDLSSDNFSGILSDIFSGIILGILSDIYPDSYSDILFFLSGIHSESLTWQKDDMGEDGAKRVITKDSGIQNADSRRFFRQHYRTRNTFAGHLWLPCFLKNPAVFVFFLILFFIFFMCSYMFHISHFWQFLLKKKKYFDQ